MSGIIFDLISQINKLKIKWSVQLQAHTHMHARIWQWSLPLTSWKMTLSPLKGRQYIILLYSIVSGGSSNIYYNGSNANSLSLAVCVCVLEISLRCFGTCGSVLMYAVVYAYVWVCDLLLRNVHLCPSTHFVCASKTSVSAYMRVH